MHAENRLAPRQIGQLNGDSAVETTRTQQRLVQNLRAVGRRQNDDALARVKAVHLGEQLVERLLALVVAAHARVVAALADGIDFVDEDDARRFLARLLEQVAHAPYFQPSSAPLRCTANSARLIGTIGRGI